MSGLPAEPPAEPPAAPPAHPGDREAAARVAAALTARLEATAPAGLGVAVSGGGDSVALLLACADWRAGAPGRRLAACTVDHNLRAEAKLEARAMAALCARLKIPHRTLSWRATGAGNLAEAAREGRAALLCAWAAEEGLGAVALGHTRDDQAETLLLRLARGSGLDGLSSMREGARRGGALWLRPALGLEREALRAFLRARGQGWFEDPSNDDPARDRVRARRALAILAPLGVEAAGLAATAARLAEDSDLLRALSRDLGREAVRIGGAGELVLDRPRLRAAPAALRRRLLGRLLRLLASAAHPPRQAALAALDEALMRRGPMPARTLHGCVISAPGESARIHREPAALPARGPTPLDGRWAFRDAPSGAEPGPLGAEGLAQLRRAAEAGEWAPAPPWTAAPRGARAASPALWEGEVLAAAPLADWGKATVLDLLVARILR